MRRVVFAGGVIAICCFLAGLVHPMDIKFVVPPYRDNIYATQNISTLQVETRLDRLSAAERRGATLILELKDDDRMHSYSRTELENPPAVSLIKLDAADLSVGRYVVSAVLQDVHGDEVCRQESILNKLPYKAEEVWIDEHGVTHVDGKPFFPHGWFGGPLEATDEYNATMTYWRFPTEQHMTDWLDRAHESGLKVFIYPYQEFLPGNENLRLLGRGAPREGALTPEQAAQIEYVVRKYRDHPAILAWYMADEPKDSVDWYRSVYDLLAEIDPYHPCIMLHDHIPHLIKYHGPSDILMPDPYPDFKRNRPPRKGMDIMGKFVEAAVRLRPTWVTPQAFDWSLLTWDQAHDSRGPTFDELRNQAYQAIIHGAKGIYWYQHANIHYLYNPEQKVGMPFLTKEIFALQEAVLSPGVKDGVSVSLSKERPFSYSLREAGGHFYLFSVNTSEDVLEAEFALPGIGAGEINVVSENRIVRLENESFRDSFSKYETHIYTTDPSLGHLTSIQDVKAKIEEEKIRRRKPGNILFREYIDDGIKIAASSSLLGGLRNQGLIFLLDGITEDVQRLYWRDTTPDIYPDWVDIEFANPEKISRIVVYTADLEDFEFQVDSGSGWETVKEVRGNESRRVEAVFSPVDAMKIRIYITGSKGRFSTLYEIEAYRE